MIKIRKANINDLKEIYRIEKESFPDPYPYGLLKAFLFHPGVYLVAIVEEKIIGYCIGIIRNEDIGHIISIAVDKNYRRRGIGTILLRNTINELMKLGARKIRIEVRESNIAAIKLYEKIGFREKEKIYGYYSDDETAIVMFLELENHQK
ncbi:MAG: ribosomal-protein-alanine N-acetyltransferase [Candidatus Methanomethylicota archaeon]|jgi:ribosomal-protein-alanine N-acetyltransferase|uniref:Ribosomal-protein-alanine N-acetyltransferase n=1 Tax=Thermoproteota archaeon TaxID=2056631 RepID=A0A523BAX7_9CREN|nr:MAG: ribosomal-protein-alanine N-acetyltransferase [Candidatus Verstraetearchaeota archaeon]TDA38075.1 MAG: ribosomal-protein-alanine N-acetyltransferase [Candidatus Verstraetearchaeota archaeon]